MEGYTDLGPDGQHAQPNTILTPGGAKEENMTSVLDHAEATQDRPVTPPPTGPTDNFPRVTDKEKAENWKFCSPVTLSIMHKSHAYLHDTDISEMMRTTKLMNDRVVDAFITSISASLNSEIRIVPTRILADTLWSGDPQRNWQEYTRDLGFKKGEIKQHGLVREFWVPVRKEQMWSLLVLNIPNKTAELTLFEPAHASVCERLEKYVNSWIRKIWRPWIVPRERRVRGWAVDVIEAAGGSTNSRESGLWLCRDLYMIATGANPTIDDSEKMEWKHFVAAKARAGAHKLVAAREAKDPKVRK